MCQSARLRSSGPARVALRVDRHHQRRFTVNQIAGAISRHRRFSIWKKALKRTISLRKLRALPTTGPPSLATVLWLPQPVSL